MKNKKGQAYIKKGYNPHNKGKKGWTNKGSFKKGHKMLEGSEKGWFKNGNQINLGRERPDMIGNRNWDNPNNPIKKGHKMNVTTEISLYRKKVKRDRCTICNKKVKINKENLERKRGQINLDVHHKDNNKYNNSVNNLLVVCRSCHMLIHNGGIKYG